MQDDAYLPRHADAVLARARAVAPVVMLDGARAVGKSTTAERVAASALYLPRDLPILASDPESVLEAMPRPVLIDEWQLAGTDLLWAVKRIVDADPAPDSFILAGSVEPATYGPTYPLTGRSVRVVMRPMTHAELAGCGDATVPLEAVAAGEPPRLAGPAPTLEWDALAASGLPLAHGMPDARGYLDAYALSIAQRAGDEGRDATRLHATMRVLATLESEAVPASTIWDAADINKATWKAYEDLLARTHVAVPTRAYDSNRLKRLTSFSKRFLADTALALSLADLDGSALASDPSTAGHYLESYVMQQLRPQVDVVGARLSHLRTSAGGREVDAIIETRTGIVGIEVKSGRRPTPADAVNLAWLRDELPERWVCGLVLHRGEATYPLGDRIWAAPITALM